MKKIDTLVDDMYSVLTDGADLTTFGNQLAIDQFMQNIEDMIQKRLSKDTPEYKPSMRLSGIGKCERSQWYDNHQPTSETLSGQAYFKFMFGDVIEELALLLAKLSGHEVTGEQTKIKVDGVVGHRDAVIDGFTVDVKSASKFGMMKFRDGDLGDDSFGYLDQISAYRNGADDVDKSAAYFLAIGKELGNIELMEVTEFKDTSARIQQLRDNLVDYENPPIRPYTSVPQSNKYPNSNKKLPVACSYCKDKFKCWADANSGEGIRTFKYSNGPVYLTEVHKQPRVEEVTNG